MLFLTENQKLQYYTQLQKLQAGKVSKSTLANILKVVCGSAKEKAWEKKMKKLQEALKISFYLQEFTKE